MLRKRNFEDQEIENLLSFYNYGNSEIQCKIWKCHHQKVKKETKMGRIDKHCKFSGKKQQSKKLNVNEKIYCHGQRRFFLTEHAKTGGGPN